MLHRMRRRLGSGRGRRLILYVLGATAVAIGGLYVTLLLSRPHLARADQSGAQDSDPMVMDTGHTISASSGTSITLSYMKDQATGRIVYCKNTIFKDPPDSGSSLPYMGEVSSPVLDYIIYHGYSGDDSITIGSITGDADALYLATQLAIYDVVYGRSTSDSYYPSNSRYRYIADAANQLYDEAVAYADAGGHGVEEGHAIWYQGTTSSQDIITIRIGGTVRIEKSSAAPNISASDTGYTLEGATFKVYSDEDLTNEVAEVVTDATGVATTPYLAYGTYWIKEVVAPHGFVLHTDPWKVELSTRVSTLPLENSPLYSLVSTVLRKVDSDTEQATPQGGGSIAGARFLVSYYACDPQQDVLPDSPTRTWTLETDSEGYVRLDDAHRVSGDAFYTDSSGAAALPLGIVVVEETDPPLGYTLPANTEWTTRVTADVCGTTITLVNTPVEEQAIRGDIVFAKHSSDTDSPMSHVLFRVTSETTGESHIIMTDTDGSYSSLSHVHSERINALDGIVDDSGTVDESQLSDDYRTWFYGYHDTAMDEASSPSPDGTRGCFPYDTYLFEELASSSTEGHELMSFEVAIREDGTIVDQGIVQDVAVVLSTEACDASDGDKYLDASQAGTVLDKVSYQGLTPNVTYTLVCTLMDASTKTKLYRNDGTSYEETITFVPNSSEGTQEVHVDFDPTTRHPTKVVAFERLLREGKLIARHEDLDDANQTVYIPTIDTVLASQNGDLSTVEASSRTKLVDTVTYKGLVQGATYVLNGTLVDKQSGKTIVDGNGKTAVASTTFVAGDDGDSVSVPFDLDTTTLGDCVAVAYESLTADGVVICTHEDKDDADQTVNIARHRVLLPDTGSADTLVVGGMSACLLAIGVSLLHRLI